MKEDNILNNLDNYVKEENIDVICITNYKRNIFARLFNPSIARKMIFHANTPILVINKESRRVAQANHNVLPFNILMFT